MAGDGEEDAFGMLETNLEVEEKEKEKLFIETVNRSANAVFFATSIV